MKTLDMPRKAVAIGSTVEIRDLHSNDLEKYTLVRPHEADIAFNRISSLTPVGRALYGRRPGQVVAVDAPGGTFRVRIEAIEHQPDG
jgi:regulator of nucleoside diphosphate kinase